jgi:SNF2 family DNA or RNA helicase
MKHQEEGVSFLLSRGSGLVAFEQGLGKTLVAIEAFARLKAGGRAEAMLVVCPNSLKRNWQSEVERFHPELNTVIVEGGARARRTALATVTVPIVILSYETARAEVTPILAMLSRMRTVLVLDESHFVKNRQSFSSIAAQHLGVRARYRWLLSGTPVTNSPSDLCTQVGIVANRPSSTLESLLSNLSHGEPLSAALAPYVLRRTKAECLDLPDKAYVDLHIELPAWQRSLYEQARDSLVSDTQRVSEREFRGFASQALTRLVRLAQIATNPRLILSGEHRTPGKFTELDHLVNELVRSGNHKAILWSHYVGTIETLLDRYKDAGACAIYGDVPAGDRQHIAQAFQNDANVRLMIANPAAAGTGFTLTAASYAMYESLSWRYDLYAQSQDRNHRIGQTLPVTYIRLIAVNTIEEVMAASVERKGGLARGLLGDEGDAPKIAELTRDEFCEMLINNTLPRSFTHSD